MKTIIVLLLIILGVGCAGHNEIVITEGRGYFTGTKYCAVIAGKGVPPIDITYEDGTCTVKTSEVNENE